MDYEIFLSDRLGTTLPADRRQTSWEWDIQPTNQPTNGRRAKQSKEECAHFPSENGHFVLLSSLLPPLPLSIFPSGPPAQTVMTAAAAEEAENKEGRN